MSRVTKYLDTFFEIALPLLFGGLGIIYAYQGRSWWALIWGLVVGSMITMRGFRWADDRRKKKHVILGPLDNMLIAVSRQVRYGSASVQQVTEHSDYMRDGKRVTVDVFIPNSEIERG